MHKSGANSMLYNVAMKGLPLMSRIFIWTYPVCFVVTKFLSSTSIYLSVSANESSKKPEISGVMWQVAPESKKIGQLRDISNIASRTLWIGIHTWHRRVYLLWFVLICTVFQRLIYFCQCVRTSFRLFCVPVNFIFRSVLFKKICDEMILQSTSESSIWVLTIVFSTLFIIFQLMEGWFLIALLLYLLIYRLSWMWNSTATTPWLSKNISFYISYLIFQIQVINLQGKYR